MRRARDPHRHGQRQHLEAGARVVGATVGGDREKVRDLPEEQHREQRQPRRIEVARHRRPAHERRQRARHGAHEQRRAREALQRRVDRHVAGDRDEAEDSGQEVAAQEHQRDADAGHPGAERQRRLGRHDRARQRPVARPFHQRVGVAFQVHVQRVRRGDQQRRADQRHDRPPVRDLAGRQPQPAQEGDHHHPRDARLAEADHAREPLEADAPGHDRRIRAQDDQHLRREQRGGDGQVRLDRRQVEEAGDGADAERDLHDDQQRARRSPARAGRAAGPPGAPS